MFYLWRVIAVFLVAASSLAAADDPRPWPDYRVVMWVGNSAYKQPAKVPLFFERMREMGVNAATVHADASAAPVAANGFSFYVENIVNRGLCLKFNSTVRDWDAFIRGWMSGGRPESALQREFSFDDPEWRGWARRQMQAAVRKHRDGAPFAYDIRDELSTTISANPFDFDFSPTALAGFRVWLHTQYRDLAALNTQWDTAFASWDEVWPFTTDQIKSRMATGEAMPRGTPDWAALRRVVFEPTKPSAASARWNFAPWCDFRTYLDLSLAGMLGELRAAARELDPRTPVGIEGTQMPSAFGGYDLWRLAQVLDWVEPYDIGGAREILGSFMPGKPILTTVFEKDALHAERRLWHLLLEGDRGCVVWWSEDCIDWQSADYALTAKARALAPVFRGLQSPLATLFRRARREVDPIYLVYSQASLQVDWLLESTGDGATWPRRFSSFEASHNQLAQRRVAWLKLFQDLGYTPQFVAAEKMGDLARALPPNALLVLADALALSEHEVEAAREFRTRGGRVWRDDATASFDAHGKRRATPVALKGAEAAPAVAAFARDRLSPAGGELLAAVESRLERSRAVQVPAGTHTRVHRFQLGAARLVAFERGVAYHMSEDLKQAGGNETLERPVDLVARLEEPAHVYDLRTQRYLGRTDRMAFTLEPWRPSLFALVAQKLPDGDVIEQLQAAR